MKNQILSCLHRVQLLKKSSSFFYDLTCRLTETNDHGEYNLDGHLVPFCKKEQILDILSRWSINSLKQIDSLSVFYSKLIKYQASIIIHLIKSDLNQIKTNYEKFSNYFRDNKKVVELIAEKEPRELVNLFLEYLNQLEKHQRFLPDIIQSKQIFFFKKVPNEMIELIAIVASRKSGSIYYKTSWGSDSPIGQLSFPRSLSIENYVKLFFILYETCNWSSNHFIQILEYMLSHKDENLSSIKKQRKVFFDIIVQQRIGKDLFVQKLLKDGNDTILQLLDGYPELTNPLSIHLLSKYERNEIVTPEKRLTLIRYQIMTKELFDLFLSLFKQTGSNVNQRQKNYPLFLQCAFSTDEQFTQNVLQWIEKRFVNEQILVIDHFLSIISSFNDRFHLEILPKNFKSIQTIFDIAINHLQRSTNTLSTIINYGVKLLQLTEKHSNKDNIQQFAIQIIKQCYSKTDNAPNRISTINKSYPSTRKIIINLLLSDVFPRLVSKGMVNELNNFLSSYNDEKQKCLPEIDLFLNEFFTKSLPSSKKLQSSFNIDTHSSMIKLYLANKSTRFERVNYLINQIDKIFFIDQNIQRIILRSQQHRTLIDQLIQDNKLVTLDKITNEDSPFVISNSQTKNVKLPGLNVEVLNNSSQFLTGKQQEHIANIIRNDYLQVNI